MKKIKLFIMILIMCTITTLSFCQDSWILDTNHVVIRKNKNNIGEQVTPGSELRLYTFHHYKGVVLSTVGITTTVLGGYFITTGITTTEGGTGVIVVGGILSVIGLVYVLEAPIHIKRASLLLDKYGIGVKIDL